MESVMNSFHGFPKDLFLFLNDLSKKNNRDWFNENKDRYQKSVVLPVKDFIIVIGERLHEISKSFMADPRTNGGSMFRIYRDIRFSKDKRPYKEHVGCQFRHIAGKTAHAPGFYVHLQPGNVFVGGGIWKPPNPVLDKIRTAIVEEPEKWSGVMKGITFFSAIEGDQLKRPPRGYDADHPLIKDLKRKSFFLKHNVEPSSIMKAVFMEETVQAFMHAAPLMKFITNAIGLSF
jgi:uncharacterized protein (TIGR02453 family)